MPDLTALEAIHSARSLRRFKPDPIPDNVLTQILDAAVRAPTGSSAQNWIFMVVKEQALKNRLGEIYRKASQIMMAEHDERAIPAHMEQKQFDLMRRSASHLFDHLADSPVLLIAGLRIQSVATKSSPLGPERDEVRGWRTSGANIYPAIHNILLDCRALGLGTVLTTIHTFFEDEVKELLGLPADVQTYALMPIGYPLDKFGPVRRRPLKEVAFLDRFGNEWSA
jgi:nitroreductase